MRIFSDDFSFFLCFAALFTSNRNENTITFDYIYKSTTQKKNQQSYEIQYGVGCYDVFRIYLPVPLSDRFTWLVRAPYKRIAHSTVYYGCKWES